MGQGGRHPALYRAAYDRSGVSAEARHHGPSEAADRGRSRGRGQSGRTAVDLERALLHVHAVEIPLDIVRGAGGGRVYPDAEGTIEEARPRNNLINPGARLCARSVPQQRHRDRGRRGARQTAQEPHSPGRRLQLEHLLHGRTHWTQRF